MKLHLNEKDKKKSQSKAHLEILFSFPSFRLIFTPMTLESEETEEGSLFLTRFTRFISVSIIIMKKAVQKITETSALITNRFYFSLKREREMCWWNEVFTVKADLQGKQTAFKMSRVVNECPFLSWSSCFHGESHLCDHFSLESKSVLLTFREWDSKIGRKRSFERSKRHGQLKVSRKDGEWRGWFFFHLLLKNSVVWKASLFTTTVVLFLISFFIFHFPFRVSWVCDLLDYFDTFEVVSAVSLKN